MVSGTESKPLHPEPAVSGEELLQQVSRLKVPGALKRLQTSLEEGLSDEEAQRRETLYGPNEAERQKSDSPFMILLHQFNSSVVYLLLAAACVSASVHEYLQTTGILLAVFINAITGFIMEYKASTSLAELVKLTGNNIRARRSGREIELPVSRLVPGDIVLLEPGSRIPADLRILDCASLSIDESPVTGESVPVFKSAETGRDIEPEQTLAMTGTLVTSGRATAMVVATGAHTSLGRLGKMLGETDTGATPLERQLEVLGRQLTVLTVAICTALLIVGIVQGRDLFEMIETSVALAVAAIPEGLPVLATLALAVGTRRMVKNRAIIRRLSAVETLGCTKVICSDKTGTLTENRMLLTDVAIAGATLTVSGKGYEPKGGFFLDNEEIKPSSNAPLTELLIAGGLCNDAKIEHAGDHEDQWQCFGDPTEGALLAALMKSDLQYNDLKQRRPRVAEFPFDLERKRMTTVHKTESGHVAFVKGSPETTIELCTAVLTADGEQALDEQAKTWFLERNHDMAAKGLRVLGVARKSLPDQTGSLSQDLVEDQLTLLGLVGISDRPKEGVKEAIEKCKKAGIEVLMLTGDQKATAAAVASELGISSNENNVITGQQFLALPEESRVTALSNVNVLARVTPDLKLAVVKALQQGGNIIAMTGDGVNDAPALKQSNIGVAMGRQGTDLARAVSQMVITDDNFATIVKAIEQGRIIYANIQNAVGYLLTASLAAVATVSLGVVFGIGLPLTALQLLWLNLIMHIFPGLGIVLQKANPAIMSEQPRNPEEKIIGGRQFVEIAARSLAVSLMVLAAIEWAAHTGIADKDRTTVGLCTLSISLLLQAFAWLKIRKTRSGSIPRVNKAMAINMAIAFCMLLAAIYIPGLNTILETSPPGSDEIAIIFACSICSVLAAELFSLIANSVLKVFSKNT